MSKLIKVISGFFIGLGPFLAASMISFTIYYSYPKNTIGIIIIIAILTGALWLGISIFKKVQIVGPLEFITAVNASPELDNLELSSDSETKMREPDEIVELIRTNDNLFKGGTIRIFGDWFGKEHDNIQTIKSAEFNKETHTLIILFDNKVTLEIENPKHIFEVSAFLKIIKADRIKLKWYRNYGEKWTANPYQIIYNCTNKKIETETNVDYYKPYLDVSLSAPALMIYG